MSLPLGLAVVACSDDGGEPAQTMGSSGSSGTTGMEVGPTPGTTLVAMSTTEVADGTSSTSVADETTTGDEIEPPPPLPWTEDCVYDGSDLSELDPDLLCMGVEVPLDWDEPEGESIVIAAYKLPTTADVRLGQFWLLDGGPGSSGMSLAGSPEFTVPLRGAGWDVIVPAHRGTLSPSLDCGTNPSTAACRIILEDEWGDGLRHFNSSAAGHDLAALIERERQIPEDPVVVYGVSYGTMWGMHYAALHPEQADGLVLDSVLPAEVEVLTQEPQQQAAVEVLLQRCIDDPACGPTMPYRTGAEFAAAVVAAVDGGDCGGLDDGLWLDSVYRDQLGFLLNGNARDYVPLLAALLAACTPQASDTYAMAIGPLINSGFSFSPVSGGASMELGPRFEPAPVGGSYAIDPELYFSSELQFVVVGTSILREEQDPTPITDAAQQNLVGLGFAGLFLATHDVWTTLPDVALLPPFPETLPTLVLAGAFDLQTPLGWAEPLALEGEHQQLLVFDSANHGVIGSGNTADGEPCGRDIILEFAQAPTEEVDVACLDEVPRVDPALLRADLLELSAMVFGIDDPWLLVP